MLARAARATLAADVDTLCSLVLPRTSSASKSPEQLEQISTLTDKIAASGAGQEYLTDDQLFGNYEVAFFDRSVDGNRSQTARGGSKASRRSKLLGTLFRLRHSFQHVVRPNTVVNFVGFRLLGVPATVTARGRFTPLTEAQVAEIADEHGTALRAGTSVRIDFERPRIAVGPLSLELGGSAAQPPVDICFTYVDEKLRLGLAARGGKFVFTRGGLADEPYADDWQAILARPPTSGIAVGAAAAACGAVLAATLPPMRRPIVYAGLAAGALAAVKTADAKRRARRRAAQPNA